MIRKRFTETVLLAVFVGVVVSAQPRASTQNNRALEKNPSQAKADLLIREFVFPADNDKTVRVRIVNGGSLASALCVLRLMVRKITDFRLAE